jgi:extracellular matrix protein 14
MRSLILSLLVALVSVALAVPPGNPAYLPVRFAHPPKAARPWTRFRDQVIKSVWRIPDQEKVKKASCKSDGSNPGTPSKLFARYGGDVVLRFHTSTPDEVRALAEASNTLLLDVWEFTDDWVDIRLSKDVVPSLLEMLPSSLQHAHTPLMHDLAQTIFESYPAPALTQRPSKFERSQAFTPALHSSPPDETNLFFRDYQPLSVITPWMRLLTSLFPSHVQMINIGISYEGRDIPALRVGVHPTNSDKPSSPRKTIIIAGGSHAREWISVTTVNYVAYSLITSYGKSQSITKLLEEFDWVFIPTMNPDGYVYTWEYDRLWRKNRQQTELRFCRGVDLDRSWGFAWDGEATKSNPCSESFAGEGPFDAVESRRLADWARNETDNNNASIVGFLDLHSYSQQVLYPYSYSCRQLPPSLENLEELAINLAKSIRLTNRRYYGIAPACDGSVFPRSGSDSKSGVSSSNSGKDEDAWPKMESSAGSALDWFYHEMHVRYAYQIKLRDEGSYGFLLPRENIVPTGREILSAAVGFGEFILGDKGIEKRVRFEEKESISLKDGDDGMGEPLGGDAVDDKEDDEEGVGGWELRRRRRRR